MEGAEAGWFEICGYGNIIIWRRSADYGNGGRGRGLGGTT